ncbi:hypothetical protein [Nitrincola sp.]|uniref:hypothetical protein n=1 Tax=Nitrincola sp. TaxID=1926584 RepID=UPI003A90198B
MRKKIVWTLLALSLLFVIWAVFFSPQWLEGFNQQRADEASVFRQQGLTAGEQMDQQGCQDQALTGFAACSDSNFVCTVNQGVFLKSCFEVAAPTNGFCDGVPAFHDKATEEEKDWAKYNCWDMDIRGEGCRLLLRQRIEFCDALGSTSTSAGLQN